MLAGLPYTFPTSSTHSLTWECIPVVGVIKGFHLVICLINFSTSFPSSLYPLCRLFSNGGIFHHSFYLFLLFSPSVDLHKLLLYYHLFYSSYIYLYKLSLYYFTFVVLVSTYSPLFHLRRQYIFISSPCNNFFFFIILAPLLLSLHCFLTPAFIPYSFIHPLHAAIPSSLAPLFSYLFFSSSFLRIRGQ